MNQDIGMTLMIENSAPPGWILTGRDMIFPADELTKHHRTPYEVMMRSVRLRRRLEVAEVSDPTQRVDQRYALLGS